MDLISRQDVIDLLQMNREEEYKKSISAECKHKSVIRSKHDAHVAFCDYLIECVKQLSSAQMDRDIPVKPIETTDRAWGIPNKQAACPKCDYYLGHVSFLGDYKGKRITYCETCGQAINWEGWGLDE